MTASPEHLTQLTDRVAQWMASPPADVATLTPTDWELLPSLCATHGVASLLHIESPSTRGWPTSIQNWLISQYQHNYARMSRMAAELADILTLFEKRGVRVMAMKGLAISEQVYLELGSRPMNDIDLLIDAESNTLESVVARSEKPKVVVVGDGLAATGFSRVIHSILGPLSDRYDFHHFAINYGGQEHAHPWTMYPAAQDGDYLGREKLSQLIEDITPALVFFVNDVWVVGSYLDALHAHANAYKTLAYCPVDAAPLEPNLVAGARRLDANVVYTTFGQRTMGEAFAQLDNTAAQTMPMFVIPHGVNTSAFYPLPEENGLPGRIAARRRLFRTDTLDDAFIVLNGNRHQPRKRVDITLRGFADFATGKPDNVKLYLHMGVQDCGWDVITLARRYGIEDRLILTSDTHYLFAVPDDVLNCIYNACDVGINTSTGEGWGLVSFEHAAAGAAQVVPRHSACEELWDGNACLLDPAVIFTSEHFLTEGHLVAPAEVARALEYLYQYPEQLKALSACSHRVATQPAYCWDNIVGEWDKVFSAALDQQAVA